MNFKRINIKYRYIFQIAIFIIYAVLLSCIFLFIMNRIQKDRDISRIFQKLQSQITVNHNSYQNFLLNTKNGDSFYREGENYYTNEFQNSIALIRDSLSILKSKTNYNNRIAGTALFDSVLQGLDNYQAVFRQTTLVFKELGDRNSGKMALLINSSENLLNLFQGVEIPEISSFPIRLIDLEFEYLANPGKAKYNEIMYLLDELKYNPALSESESSSLLMLDIGQQVDTYKECLEDLQNTVDRLSGNSEDAFYSLMETSLAQLITASEKLIVTQETILKNKTRWLILLGMLIIVILSILYVIQFIAFYNRLGRPLHNTIDYCYSLSKGKIPDNTLATEVPLEISYLNENLNRITISLQEKKTFVDSLLKQKFDTDLNLQGKNDTFGKTLIALKENMRKARDEQIKHAEDNQVRRYQNEGIAKFADILRNNSDNLDKLSDIFIKEIVNYLEAIQGGLFLLENDNETLKLAGAFAYNRKKYLTRSIKMGESLVGTCALEKKTINLSEIPDEYIEITSGLGDAPPNNLLLLPVMHEEQLIGVLEIASLTKFDSNQISLSEKITESLASTIINARVNSQTSELLQKSQQQAAEMAEQEEEMRQNMEELKATQEESARREEELESILNAIDQSFYVLEYDIEGIITKVNQRFLYLVNLSTEKVIGLKHSQLFGKSSKADSLFFANIAEGNTVELVEKVEVNNKLLEIKNTFCPVRKKAGDTLRILNIMTVVI